MLLNSNARPGEVVHISAGEENSVRFADIDNAMAQALEKAPVGDKYAQVSYETLVRMRRKLKHIFGPCNERRMLKACGYTVRLPRLTCASATISC